MARKTARDMNFRKHHNYSHEKHAHKIVLGAVLVVAALAILFVFR